MLSFSPRNQPNAHDLFSHSQHDIASQRAGYLTAVSGLAPKENKTPTDSASARVHSYNPDLHVTFGPEPVDVALQKELIDTSFKSPGVKHAIDRDSVR